VSRSRRELAATLSKQALLKAQHGSPQSWQRFGSRRMERNPRALARPSPGAPACTNASNAHLITDCVQVGHWPQSNCRAVIGGARLGTGSCVHRPNGQYAVASRARSACSPLVWQVKAGPLARISHKAAQRASSKVMISIDFQCTCSSSVAAHADPIAALDALKLASLALDDLDRAHRSRSL
jgi:hypothetical protein